MIVVFYRCKADILELLLKKGANIDIQTVRKETALHFAVFKYSRECLCLGILSAHNANPNLQVV